MKDLKEISDTAIRNVILKEFELQIPNSWKKLNIIDISNWKKLKKVKECYNILYDDKKNAIENVIKQVFSNISFNDKTIFNDIYIYTAAICDILLNSKYSDSECAKKPLKRCFQKFKVIFFC